LVFGEFHFSDSFLGALSVFPSEGLHIAVSQPTFSAGLGTAFLRSLEATSFLDEEERERS